ncbi:MULTISPECIES: tRNA dihydrouridine synthase [unclassified Acinetobacter]|uniref:tRNA dihydrouridine synthase n=1 Tax=unclassified Acinetobacter TaxID=196816 RepID=UPI0035BA9798
MKLILAPMEGLTDPVMRQVLTSIGYYDWCVTEFIRVTDSVLPDHIFYHYCPELKNQSKTVNGTPVHVQFLGNRIDMLAANAVKVAEMDAAAIDLNFGCPAKTVNRHRGGAVLLDEPETIYQIVHAVRQAVPQHIPVSAKMRLGYLDDHHSLDNALAIQSAGASWLTIHARTKTDGYTPPAYWEKIAPLKSKIHIPIIANGEIWTVQDALSCQQQSDCVDLMLGRGAVTTPDLVNRIRQQNHGNIMPWQELLAIQLAFLDGEYKTELALLGRYKQWLGMLTKSYPEAQILWQQVKKIKDLDQIRTTLQQASI